jgi:hypothetical protein
MAPVIQKAGLKILFIKTPKSHRRKMKYPYTTIDITFASQVSGQVLLLDVVLAVGRSFLLMISVRALSGKQPVDDLLRLARNVPTEIHFGYREIGVELLAQKSIEPLAGRSSFKSFSTTDLRDQF